MKLVTVPTVLSAIGALAVFSCCLLPLHLSAQEVESDMEIVNRDGERVNARVIAVHQDDDDREITVNNEDGKITIVDADGNKREIDVSGAQSIIVNQAIKSILKDGEKQTEAFGKAIIIGPDGVRQEIELGGPLEGQLNERVPGRMRLQWEQSNKYMIGVNCTRISEALRTQLDLETGTGLVVEGVVDDSPAGKAGLEQHDILMFADDTHLADTSDLVDAVQRAGKENSKLSLTVIRKGKEIGIDIAPIERPAGERLELPGGFKGVVDLLPQFEGKVPFDFEFKQMGPGVILGPDFNRDDFHKRMQEQMEAMRAEIEQMQKLMHEQKDR
jgi:serine protease Do